LDSGNIHESPLKSHDAPLPEVNTSGSAEDSVKLKELIELVPKLVVKTLEVALKRKSKKVVLLELEGEEADNSFKQGRKSQDDRSEDFITPSKVASGGVSTYKRRRRSVDTDKAQRKGKAKMVEENVQTAQKTKKQLEQEKAGFAEGVRLQAQLDAEVEEQIYTDEMIAKRMKEEIEMTDQQKKRMAQNQGTWKLSQLKKLTFEEIKEKFDKLVNQIDTFVPMSLEATKARMKRYSEELQTGILKKQKTVDDSGFAELQEKVAAKDVLVTEEKAGETIVPKEEEVEKSTKIKRRRLKTKARKGLNVDKDA
ncbi:hypothetical protein Tco_0002900, partial [Tanacetum coccineum]